MKIAVKLVRSVIKRGEKQEKIVKALGLHRMGRVRIHDDNAVIRGMIAKVSHLVEVTEVKE